LALTEFAKLKGIELTWYTQIGYKHEGKEMHKRVTGIPEEGMSYHALTKDCGEEVESLPGDYYYYPSFYEDEERCDHDLINVIESLGDKANGFCSSLAIKEIPDGASFEITEYDGREDVVPPRMSW